MTSPGRTSPTVNILIAVSVLFAGTVALLAVLGSGAVGVVAGVGGVLVAGAWLIVGRGGPPAPPAPPRP